MVQIIDQQCSTGPVTGQGQSVASVRQRAPPSRITSTVPRLGIPRESGGCHGCCSKRWSASYITCVGEGEYAYCHVAALTWLRDIVTSTFMAREINDLRFGLRSSRNSPLRMRSPTAGLSRLAASQSGTEVARIGRRATRDVRLTREEYERCGGLQ